MLNCTALVWPNEVKRSATMWCHLCNCDKTSTMCHGFNTITITMVASVTAPKSLRFRRCRRSQLPNTYDYYASACPIPERWRILWCCASRPPWLPMTMDACADVVPSEWPWQYNVKTMWCTWKYVNPPISSIHAYHILVSHHGCFQKAELFFL